MEERLCEYFIPSWLRSNEGRMKSHNVYSVSSRRWWKTAWEALLVAGFGLQHSRAASLDTTLLLWCNGPEGKKWWRTELNHPIHQDAEAVYMYYESLYARVCIPHFLYYSWLEAIAICLMKRLWMDPDLVHTLQIVVWLCWLHLGKRNLNVANVFCMLE